MVWGSTDKPEEIFIIYALLISDIFDLSNRIYNLRNSDNFPIPRISTTTYGKDSIRYIVL